MKIHEIIKKENKHFMTFLAFILMGLFFLTACEDLLDNGNNGNDDHVYQTVVIGDQEWFAENLRVSKYNNGDDIITGLSGEEWSATTEGAYAIFDHAEGINSPEEMVAAYGKLYNYYAVADPRGLCPEGWHVPSDADWKQLVDYLMDQYDYHNGQYGGVDGVGNALKSCFQVDSPLGGDCDTSAHPRWDSHDTHHGLDGFGFAALPGGLRFTNGSLSNIGSYGGWWTSTEHHQGSVWSWYINNSTGNISNWFGSSKRTGYSVRCVRNVE